MSCRHRHDHHHHHHHHNQIFVMKEGHHKVFTLFGGTKLLTCNSQVCPSNSYTMISVSAMDSKLRKNLTKLLFSVKCRLHKQEHLQRKHVDRILGSIKLDCTHQARSTRTLSRFVALLPGIARPPSMGVGRSMWYSNVQAGCYYSVSGLPIECVDGVLKRVLPLHTSHVR